MNQFPKVSIIITTYNRQEDSLKAIKSAHNQTYENTEIIVVDDGSKDDTVSKISALETDLLLIQHDTNKGANAARNTGLNASSGEWIAFLDSDDTWHKEKLRIMMDKLFSHPKCSSCYCSMHHILKGEKMGTFKAVHSGDLYKKLLVENIVGSASVPILKKSVLEDVGGFDEYLKSNQDWDLWLRIAKKGYLFLAEEKALVNYKLPDTENHISGSLNAFWEGRKAFIDKHYDKYINDNKQALGTVYSNIGFLLLARFHNPVLARKCFIKAVKYNPLRLKSWKGLIVSFLPIKALALSEN